MKAVVAAFNQEKAIVRALVGAFLVIVKTDGSFAAQHNNYWITQWGRHADTGTGDNTSCSDDVVVDLSRWRTSKLTPAIVVRSDSIDPTSDKAHS